MVNNRGGPNSVILHKTEWNRLKQQAGPPVEPAKLQNEYLKALIEKSQGWMKTWPDTVQGCVVLKEKQKAKQRAKEIATVEEFSKKIINKNTAESIRKAKQKIFDESCYGRKLISALHESKVQEEREAQIRFSKEIKKKTDELEQKKPNAGKYCTFDLDKNTIALAEQHKCMKMKIAKQNKEMYEKRKEEEAKANEMEKLAELTDTKLMKQLLTREQEAEDQIRLLEKQALEQYTAENQKTKEERAKWEAEYYAKIEACRKEQEELNYRIKQVHQRIHKDRQDLSITKSNFETVTKCQEEEKKRYEEFIEKMSKKGEERAAKRERIANEKVLQDRSKNMSIAEINKTMATYVRERECSNKCFCDRQCLIPKSDKRCIKKGQDESEPELKEVPPPFFGPCNKLVAALKRREKAPTPWTGAKAAHELFAKTAEETLRECKYKKPARRVIDEYIKYNGLDKTTFPIPNY